MCAAASHTDDELQALVVVHTVLVCKLHVVVEKGDLAVGWARECLQSFPPNHELSNSLIPTHSSSIRPVERFQMSHQGEDVSSPLRPALPSSGTHLRGPFPPATPTPGTEADQSPALRARQGHQTS